MIWKLAGILGISPRPYSLRELKWMVQGRREETWDMVSILASRLVPEVPFLNPYRTETFQPAKITRMATDEDWAAFGSWFQKG